MTTILCRLALTFLVLALIASDGLALPPQAPAPPQAPPLPQLSCLCGVPDCVCGCQAGQPCTCARWRRAGYTWDAEGRYWWRWRQRATQTTPRPIYYQPTYYYPVHKPATPVAFSTLTGGGRACGSS